MQTSRTDSGGGISKTADRPTGPRQSRHRLKTAHNSSRRGCYAFLTKPIPAVVPSCITFMCDDNLITHENYEYLRDSYLRYAQLLHVDVKHNPGNNCGEGIINLYEEMNALVGPSLNVNFELSDSGHLSFALWHTHHGGKYNLYWLPVRFIERLRPKFRRLVITFLHELMHSNRISDITASDDAEYVFEWMNENACCTTYDWEKRDLIDNIRLYDCGRARKLLQRIERRCYFKNLPHALDICIPQDAVEHTLLDIMQDGMQFIGDDKPAIMDYKYNPEHWEDPDFLPLELDRRINLIYTQDDIFTDTLARHIDSISQDSYVVDATSVQYLSPTTERLFVAGQYPERFFQWADRLIDFSNHII